MNPDPPLLIMAPTADACDLEQLPWCEAAKDKISVNHAKFKNLEIAEVIVDAMSFLLSRLTAAEVTERLASTNDEPHVHKLPSPIYPAIGVALSVNLTSARHLLEVDQRLLLLGQWIGDSLDATAAVWMPSVMIVHFANFDEIARQLEADDRAGR